MTNIPKDSIIIITNNNGLISEVYCDIANKVMVIDYNINDVDKNLCTKIGNDNVFIYRTTTYDIEDIDDNTFKTAIEKEFAKD